MTASSPIYKRAPSQELVSLMMEGGFLRPLVEVSKRQVSGHYHDVHFRSNEEVHVYRGLTRLLTVRRMSDGTVNLTAHSTYKTQPCAQDFLRDWRLDETGLDEGLDHYLREIDVDPRWTAGEGQIQERWSRVITPWMPFDREAVLEGPHRKGRDFARVQEAIDDLTRLCTAETESAKRWARPWATGAELDQLAVDEKGRLVLIELKDARKRSADLYYSPLQLLQYIWEWDCTLGTVRNDLQAIIDRRVAVGLTSHDIPPLVGGVRASIGFGNDNRSSEVKRRYEMVLEVVNQHLPDGVEPIETWEHTDAGPRLAT